MLVSSGATDAAIKYLPLSDAHCNNDSCLAFQAAHNLSQAQVSYYLQYQYGHWVAWSYSAILGIAILVHLSYLYRAHHRQPAPITRPSLVDKAQAIRRYFSYRRFNGSFGDKLGLPSFGILAFLLITVLFLFVLTFAVRPYYRQHRGYGSPPLAIRTGLMAASLTPLLIALSGKANLVTLLTGLSHEKLNIFHRWVGWFVFGLSVAHTIPFIVAPLHDGGYSALHKQFYKPGSFEVKDDLEYLGCGRSYWNSIQVYQHWRFSLELSFYPYRTSVTDSMKHFTSRTSSLPLLTLGSAFGILTRKATRGRIFGQHWRCGYCQSLDGSSTTISLSKLTTSG